MTDDRWRKVGDGRGSKRRREDQKVRRWEGRKVKRQTTDIWNRKSECGSGKLWFIRGEPDACHARGHITCNRQSWIQIVWRHGQPPLGSQIHHHGSRTYRTRGWLKYFPIPL